MIYKMLIKLCVTVLVMVSVMIGTGVMSESI
jgi:hypothetical protein